MGVTEFSATGGWVLRRAFVETATKIKRPALEPPLRRVVPLQANNGFNTVLARGLVEVIGTVKIAVVGHRDRWHLELGGLVH